MMRGVLFFSDFLLYSIKRNEFFEITGNKNHTANVFP